MLLSRATRHPPDVLKPSGLMNDPQHAISRI
jgi:hypothetical protein